MGSGVKSYAQTPWSGGRIEGEVLTFDLRDSVVAGSTVRRDHVAGLASGATRERRYAASCAGMRIR